MFQYSHIHISNQQIKIGRNDRKMCKKNAKNGKRRGFARQTLKKGRVGKSKKERRYILNIHYHAYTLVRQC